MDIHVKKISAFFLSAGIVLLSVVSTPGKSRAEEAVWQGYRQKRHIRGQERLKLLRQGQREELRQFLSTLPGGAAGQEDSLIAWFQRYQGRLIEDPQSWKAQLPFLQELALNDQLTSQEKQRRMKQHLTQQCRQYARAPRSSTAPSER